MKREIVCMVAGVLHRRSPGASLAEDRTYAIGFTDGVMAVAGVEQVDTYVLPEDLGALRAEYPKIAETVTT